MIMESMAKWLVGLDAHCSIKACTIFNISSKFHLTFHDQGHLPDAASIVYLYRVSSASSTSGRLLAVQAPAFQRSKPINYQKLTGRIW